MYNDYDIDISAYELCGDECHTVIALCYLIDKLLKDIQRLELECISTRYLLAENVEYGQEIKQYILEDLGNRYDDDPVYEIFKKILYDGGDPMNFCDYIHKIKKACKGDYPCMVR